jgi:anti-sigma regulatory factor (Ser/Thr protein kinase)
MDIPSKAGNELIAVRILMDTLEPYQIKTTTLERMKTAVAEATMNAMEHGNHFNEADPVKIQILLNHWQVIVRVMDHGDITTIPAPETPDIDAKLAGKQSPRGWGVFLIRHMVDAMYVYAEGNYHITELVWNCEKDWYQQEQV